MENESIKAKLDKERQNNMKLYKGWHDACKITRQLQRGDTNIPADLINSLVLDSHESMQHIDSDQK